MTEYTFQNAQIYLSKLLDQMDDGEFTSVDLIRTVGGSPVAKLVKYSTYAAVAVADAVDLEYVSQQQLTSGPMNPGTNGLYKLVKSTDDASAIVDGTLHAELTWLGTAADGVKFVSVLGGDQGNNTTITVEDPLASGQPLDVAVVGTDITISLETDGSGNLASTFTEVSDAVNADAEASALVTASVVGTGTNTPESVTASLQVTQGAGGILYEAAAGGGTAGNDITIEYVNPTVAGLAHYSYPDGVQGGNGVDFEAVTPGVSAVTVTVVDPGGTNPAAIDVVGNDITITLATDTGVIQSTLQDVADLVTNSVPASALITATVTGTAGTTASAMSVQGLTADFPLAVAVNGTDISVTLETDTSGTIVSTAADVEAGVDGTPAAAALVDTTVTGVGTTLAAAYTQTNLANGTDDGTMVQTPLAGGDNQPTGVQKFHAVAIYRSRTISHSADIAPSVTPRAVIISTAHATFLGL